MNKNYLVDTDFENTKLWKAFKAGDHHAYHEIYQRFVKVLFSYGNKITPDYSLVEDSVHDVFIELWERRKFLRATVSIKLYLLTALKRKICRKLAQQRKVPVMDNNLESNDPIDLSDAIQSYEAILIQQQLSEEQHRKLKKALEKLSPRQQEVLFLRFHVGLGYEEIAQILSLNYQSVNNTTFRAMKVLRKELYNTNTNLPLKHIVSILFLIFSTVLP